MQIPPLVLRLAMRLLSHRGHTEGDVRAFDEGYDGKGSEKDCTGGAKKRAMEEQADVYTVMFQCPIYCEESRAQCKQSVTARINETTDTMLFTGTCPHILAPSGSSMRNRLEGEAAYYHDMLKREVVAEKREGVYGREALPPLEDRYAVET